MSSIANISQENLTVCNFFEKYLFNPRSSELCETDRKVATVAAAVFCVLTAPILVGIVIGAIIMKNSFSQETANNQEAANNQEVAQNKFFPISSKPPQSNPSLISSQEDIIWTRDHRVITDSEHVQRAIGEEIPLDKYSIGQLDTSEIQSPGTGDSELEVGGYKIAAADTQGERESMEDKMIATEIKLANGAVGHLFAVYDGHGGKECSAFLQAQFDRILKEMLDSQGDRLDDLTIFNALKLTCVEANDRFVAIGDQSGSTATVAFIINGSLWVANVGDSRAVLSKDGEPVQLSNDQKNSNEIYVKSLKKRGGFILWGRAGGNLAIPRAIGDKGLPYVTARPKIKKFDLSELPKEGKNFLLLACDGLWDVMGSDQAIAYGHGKTPIEIARGLRNAAIHHGSHDNVSVMVVDLNR